MARTKRIKQVVVKVMVRGCRPARKVYVAPRGQVFTAAGVEGIVEGVSRHLEKCGLGDAMRMVQIGPAEFNFVQRDDIASGAAG